MANFPNGVGKITLAQAAANETVVAGPLTYTGWKVAGLPAGTVFEFLAGNVFRLVGTLTGTHTWVYNVAVNDEQFTSCAADFTEGAAGGQSNYVSDPEGINPATGHWSPIIIQKAHGVVVPGAPHIPKVTFAAGRTAVWSVNSIVGVGTVATVTNTWSL